MSDFVTQLRLAEKAAEDIYFAKVNRALIESIRRQVQAERDSLQPCDLSLAVAQAQGGPVIMKK